MKNSLRGLFLLQLFLLALLSLGALGARAASLAETGTGAAQPADLRPRP